MGDPPRIIDLAQVIEPHLDGGQLVSYSSRYLTKPGDNYGSVMIAVVANIKRQNGQIEELPLVAKLPPINNEIFWRIFQPQRTCITENATYKYLSPLLRELQLEAGIPEEDLFDALPQYYGSRISLNPESTMVDRDAVLLQENLQTFGFKAGKRQQMYDHQHAMLVLQNLAQYHALPIALRLLKPKEFDKHVRPYNHRFNMNSTWGPEMKEEILGETFKAVALATNNNEKTVKRVKELFDLYDAYLESPDAEDGIYTTIVHCDMWINNIMLQYDEDGLPRKLKFVDFQLAQYESLVHDIAFFLLSSVKTDVVRKHFYDFLKLYYKEFIGSLERVGISTSELKYSFEGFLDEVKRVAPLEIPHALFMTQVILADSSAIPENFKDVDTSVINNSSGVPEIIKKSCEIIELAQKFEFFD